MLDLSDRGKPSCWLFAGVHLPCEARDAERRGNRPYDVRQSVHGDGSSNCEILITLGRSGVEIVFARETGDGPEWSSSSPSRPQASFDGSR